MVARFPAFHVFRLRRWKARKARKAGKTPGPHVRSIVLYINNILYIDN